MAEIDVAVKRLQRLAKFLAPREEDKAILRIGPGHPDARAIDVVLAALASAQAARVRAEEAQRTLISWLEDRARMWGDMMKRETDDVLRQRAECWMMALSMAAQDVRATLEKTP